MMNPDNGFRRFWDQFREMDFGRGERGRRAKEDALEELRKLANNWLLTVAEKKRRRLIGPNGDRNARGRHFYSNLRNGTVLSEQALDDILAQSHRDSAKGIRSSVSRPPSAVVPPTPRSQNKSSATPTPAQPSGSGADATPLSSRPNLRDRLDARTAPLVPPQQEAGARARSTSAGRGRGTSRSRGHSPHEAPALQQGNKFLTYPNNIQRGEGGGDSDRGLGGRTRPNRGSDAATSRSGRGEATPEVVVLDQGVEHELEEGEIIDTSILSIPPTNNEQNPISTQNRNKNNKRNNNFESFPDTGRRGQGGGQPTPSTSSATPRPTAASGAVPRTSRQNAVPPTPRQPPRQPTSQPSTSTAVVPRQPPRQPPNQPSTSTAVVPRPANPVAAAVDAANRAIAPGSVIRMATRYDEEGNAIVEPEVDRVIIQGEWEEQRVWLEGDDLNVAMEAAMDLVESDQGTGNRAIAFQAWNRTRGHLGVTPTDGPRTTAGAATARDSGEALINLVQGHVVPLRDGRQLPLRARWSSQLPESHNGPSGTRAWPETPRPSLSPPSGV